LLEDLYDSRQCNRLLETETTEEAWPDDRRQASQFDAGEAYEVIATLIKLLTKKAYCICIDLIHKSSWYFFYLNRVFKLLLRFPEKTEF
jgi:hypothetical protein